ncbi:PTS transporter subunit EIIC [Paenibacillus allorhizosphaerae]|nr:PTS mannitol transporter subunit IICB [Paenibacillus allorhizosphaerae]
MMPPPGGIRVTVQRLGRLLSGMMMPNIGAFIAWGLIASLFAPAGWFPNEDFAKLLNLMITYFLPILVGYTGGQMIHGSRGGTVASIATIGVIIDSTVPMILGAMIIGPLSAAVLKKLDHAVERKVRPGSEMLVGSFSAGIVGAVMALIGITGAGAVLEAISSGLAAGAQVLIDTGLLPLLSILVEPAKVLFLNNAVGHGVLNPIGYIQSAQAGQSIIFVLESNPGPGLGILLAYSVLGRGRLKRSAGGAAVIHAIGGVHEMSFPFILMQPRLIAALIAGGVAGSFTFWLFDAGFTAAPSPGSIIAYVALSTKEGLMPALAGILAATVVSFSAAAFILANNREQASDADVGLPEKLEKEKTGLNGMAELEQAASSRSVVKQAAINKIVFACDSGMGSSAMGASILRKKMKEAGVVASVTNTAISDIPEDADLVITQKSLTGRARLLVPGAEHISIDHFLKSPAYDDLINRLKNDNPSKG